MPLAISFCDANYRNTFLKWEDSFVVRIIRIRSIHQRRRRFSLLPIRNILAENHPGIPPKRSQQNHYPQWDSYGYHGLWNHWRERIAIMNSDSNFKLIK
jgi:hypothetical protein